MCRVGVEGQGRNVIQIVAGFAFDCMENSSHVSLGRSECG